MARQYYGAAATGEESEVWEEVSGTVGSIVVVGGLLGFVSLGTSDVGGPGGASGIGPGVRRVVVGRFVVLAFWMVVVVATEAVGSTFVVVTAVVVVVVEATRRLLPLIGEVVATVVVNAVTEVAEVVDGRVVDGAVVLGPVVVEVTGTVDPSVLGKTTAGALIEVVAVVVVVVGDVVGVVVEVEFVVGDVVEVVVGDVVGGRGGPMFPSTNGAAAPGRGRSVVAGGVGSESATSASNSGGPWARVDPGT